MDSKDEQALKTVGVVAAIAVASGFWGVYNGWFPESFSAPVRAFIPPIVGAIVAAAILILVLRVTTRKRRMKKATRNSVFASFMGGSWDGKEGVSIKTGRRGRVKEMRVKLPAAQPLYDERFRDRITQAAAARMGTAHINAEPDLKRHSITFRPLSSVQLGELDKIKNQKVLTAAFAYFMPSDWDQESGVSWGRDPQIKASAEHGYSWVKIAVPGKWSLANDDVREKLHTIAATKLGTENIAATYDAVRNSAEFAVFVVTAEIAEQRQVDEKVTDLEDNFRGFFAKPVKAIVREWDNVTGEPLRFSLKYEPQRGDYLESFAMRLEQGAAHKMGRRMVVKLQPRLREVEFEPRAELSKYIGHPGIDLYKNQVDKRTLLHLGETARGGVASWELSASGTQPHAIFAGATRTGKSAAMRTVILGCAWHGIEVLCIDPKYKEFLAWQKFPNVRTVATSTEQIVETIEYVHDRIMEPRYKLAAYAKQQGRQEPQFPPVVVVIDEYIVAQREIKAWWKVTKEKGDPLEAPALEMLTKMLVKAAGANVHLLMGMQRMDVEFIPGAARDQVSFRMALGQISPALAQMAFENYYAGVGIPLVQGRGLANPDGILGEVQVYKIDEPANEETADQEILQAFLERSIELDKTAEWITPKGKFDTDLAAEVNSSLLRATAEAKNPPPPADEPTTPAVVQDVEVPVLSTAVGTIVAGDTIRNPEGLIGIVTDVEEVQIGDEWGVEISALFGAELVTDSFTEDSVIDRVEIIPDETKAKATV